MASAATSWTGSSDEGVDSADYRSFKTNGVTVDLAKGTANDGTGTDTLIEIENVKGTDFSVPQQAA